ncbi:MAG: hypothetical protein IKL24_01310 [Clostridia bacterium]|nr:hypothetical protein [Clostridia bacterium]
MIFEPKQKNKNPEVAILCLFIAAGVAFAFSGLDVAYARGVLQFFGLAFVCAMLYILIRYKFTRYRYTVKAAPKAEKSLHREDDDTEEEYCPEGGKKELPITALDPSLLVFTVEKKQGNSQWTTECLLRLQDINAVLSLPEEKERLKKLKAEKKGSSTYKYTKNMAWPSKAVISSASSLGNVLVYIEADAKLFDYLRAVAAYNNENK